MPLLESGLSEFAIFLQVFFWITLPVLLLAVLITIFFHYRRKKMPENTKQDEVLELNSFLVTGKTEPEEFFPAYALPGNHKMITEFRQSLMQSNAKYTALKVDLKELEEKYAVLLADKKLLKSDTKNENMGNIYLDVQETLQGQINRLNEQYAAEKNELLTRLEQMEKSYHNLEYENKSLLQQISALTPGEHGDEDKLDLYTRITEQEYLREVVEEKKLQVDFLQNQLEQRIKNHHLLEQQYSETNKNFQNLGEEHRGMTERLKILREESEKLKQNEAGFQQVLEARDGDILSLKEAINSKADHIIQLEKLVAELRDQNESLHHALEEGKVTINNLNYRINDKEENVIKLEEKLNGNRQRIMKLFMELSAVIESIKTDPPVVTMNPDYRVQETGELSGVVNV